MLTSVNPFDGAPVGSAWEEGRELAELAVEAATKAFALWRRSSRAERSALLRRVAEAVRDRKSALALLLVEEIGKPIAWAQGEVSRLELTFRLAADLCEESASQSLDLSFDPRGADYAGSFERFPVGPVLCIVPYNWPYNLSAHKIAPALAAGNTVILKPSPLAPCSTLGLARLIHECGCPPGVVNAICVSNEAAEGLVRDERVRIVSFTGSAAVGWRIKRLVPEKRVLLELGGDAFAIVWKDADVEWASDRIATSAYGYAGQVCISAQHVLVHEDAFTALRDRLVLRARDCPTGSPLQESTVCGPMINEAAADRLCEWIEEAERAGACALVGVERTGALVRPALLENVPFECRLGSEEAFGPVLTLSPLKTLEEAVARVNRSQYGIHCSVFARAPDVVEEAYRSLEVGGMIVNDYPTLRFDNMPYGGVKRSGFGREGVLFALEEMTETKALLVRRS
jgi:acyl-CoA reductase-like NAD-dependent aldehyde dehydrogenase